MIEGPFDLATNVVAEHGICACRELRNELVDAARSSRLEDAQVILSAACIVCGKQRRHPSAAELGYVNRPRPASEG